MRHHERDGSELGADDSFGSGAGQDDRLERADVIDPDGVEQHGDLMSGMGEIGENAPNEANFDETIEQRRTTRIYSSYGKFRRSFGT